jgi:hypothetical protein
MRPIFMDENSGFVVVIVSVTANVVSLIAYQDLLVTDGRQTFGDDTAGKSGPDNQVVKHTSAPR